jgi:uracil permease
VAGLLLAFSGGDLNLFRSLPDAAQSGKVIIDGVLSVPHFTLPKFSLAALTAIMPVAIATIPESTAHVFQLDIYVNNLARKKGKKPYDIGNRLGQNLIGDGIGDIVASLFGGPAGTNYGENISAMAITKVFSVSVLFAAAIIAIVISFITPFINAIYAIPQAVIGGIEVYLFGAIAAQGIAIMIEKKADMFDAKNIAVIAVIMIVGIGGQYAFGGNIPFLGANVPCVAGAAICGILMNLILSIGEKKRLAAAASADEEDETVSE